MTATRGSANRNGLEKNADLDNPAIANLPEPSPRDRLEYIAAMLQELRIMSEQANCGALANLIGRAHREAGRQSRKGR